MGFPFDYLKKQSSSFFIQESGVQTLPPILLDFVLRAVFFIKCKKVFPYVEQQGVENKVISLVLGATKTDSFYRSHLIDILNPKGDHCSKTVPDSVQSFDEFLHVVPEWNHSNAYISFRDDPNLKEKPWCRVQRVQDGGFCYANPVITLISYLLSREVDSEEKSGMIDLSGTIRKLFSSKMISAHIFQNQSANSMIMLKKCFSKDSQVQTKLPQYVTLDDLVQFGPGLIPSFIVEKRFMENKSNFVYDNSADLISYTNRLDSQFLGCQAMVVIGIRKGKLGENRFLLQNCRSDCQFVDVSDHYLLLHNGVVNFFDSKQLTISKFPINRNVRFAKTRVDFSSSFIPASDFLR